MIALAMPMSAAEQDRRLEEIHTRESGRLRNFIRSRVANESDAEDILQEVFFELVEAARLMKPIEQAGAWLYRVARNRIIDQYRKVKPAALDAETDGTTLEDLLPSPAAGPEAAFARRVLIEELEAALAELPDEQREAFLANEVDERSFRDLAAEKGVSINTLLSRKRYAVLHLRKRLQEIYDEFGINERNT